jgi:hypothetical protein
VTEAVKEVPPSDLAKSPNTVKGSTKHQLGVGVDMKQMMQHARSSRDIDMDGDVDKLDKTTPDEITGAEKVDQTGKMMAKYAKEKQHTKVGKAFEAVEDDMKEALDPVNPKTVHKPLLARKDADIDNNGKVDSSDEYLHKRRQAVARALAKEEVLDEAAHTHIIAKKDLPAHKKWMDSEGFDTKTKSLPKSHPKHVTHVGIVSSNSKESAYHEDGHAVSESVEPIQEGDELNMRHQVVLNKTPAGKAREIQRNREHLKYQMKATKNLGGITGPKGKLPEEVQEEVKVGDKVSFDHPMTAVPGKIMKKTGTVHKVEGDSVHVKVKDKYGVVTHKKGASELTKEEVESIQELSKTTLKSYTDKSVQDVGDNMAKSDKHSQLALDARKKGLTVLDRVNTKAAGKAQDKVDKRVSGMIKAAGKMKTEEADLTEAPNYILYHTTFSAAVQEAIAVAKKQGYEVDEEDWQNKVATGPKKPSKDKTNSYSIDLTKNGSPTKKKLQIQVYNMGEKYELNTYVQ